MDRDFIHPALTAPRPTVFTEGLEVNPQQGEFNATYHQTADNRVEQRPRMVARSAGERRYIRKHYGGF